MLQSFSDPGVTLMLAQARREAVPLMGPILSNLLPPISRGHVRRAMWEVLPSLVSGLQGDERNVLLTLARMWYTAVTGVFVSKDTAANWAVSHVPADVGATLNQAREAYLGQIADEWSDRIAEAQRASDYLQSKVSDLVRSDAAIAKTLEKLPDTEKF